VQRRRYTQVLCCQKKIRKRYGKQNHRGLVTNRFNIEQRPAIVVQKSQIDDWDGDIIIGKGHQGVVTNHIERKTKSTPSPMTTDWSSSTLNNVIYQLNHRPRKILGFKTLYELFFKKNTLLTVALHT
jgi:IS30 family transposase